MNLSTWHRFGLIPGTLFLLTFLMVAAANAQTAITPTHYTLTPVITGLTAPLGLTHAGDSRLFVLEKGGLVRVFKNGALLPTPFLDVRALVGTTSERGLLGLAFHPDYASNGWLFINYTRLDGDSVIARLTRSAGDPDIADPASLTTVLTVDRTRANHNGGHLAFGPDGYLYIGMGDSGGGGDPDNAAQSPTDLRGKMLRINVDSLPYMIPPDNPFVGVQMPVDVADEIWAFGLRNPWRYSFDRLTGDLYIGDVGQGEREEISFQLAGRPGGENYQWRRYEGTHLYSPSTVLTFGTSTPPVMDYPHTEGYSVTGGYVYRGIALPLLYGIYFFGDYGSGQIWSLQRTGGGAWLRQPFIATGFAITSFGEDAAGELYVVDFRGGRVLRLDSSTNAYPIRNRFNTPSPVLTWSPVEWAIAYQIEVDESASFTSPVRLEVAGVPPAASIQVNDLQVGRYYWRVRAADAPNVWRNWSTVESFAIVP